MINTSQADLAYELIAASKAITEPGLAAALGVGRLAVLGIVAELMVRRQVRNCLVGDGDYSGGYFLPGLAQRVPAPLRQIVSGGQPGAPTAALHVARRFGVPTGGRALHGWLRRDAETGAVVRAEWLAGYGLVEHPDDGSAVETCRAAALANVDDSDATLLLGADVGDFAAIVTARACGELRRPILTVPIVRHDAALQVEKAPVEVADWIVAVRAGRLHVAGQCRNPEVEVRAAAYLAGVFRALRFDGAE